MASKKSWRLKFVDIDASFSINTESSTIKGYMVVRAPKGEQSTYYFEKNNAEAIYAYIGLPTANWPDLYEAEAFNREYGLYISAPAGSSDEYPSYFGGAYLTTDGVIPFYNVSSKDTIDYTEKVDINKLGESEESSCSVKTFVHKVDNIDINNDDIDLAFVIGPISAEKWANLKEFSLNYWGDSNLGKSSKTVYYYIDKDSRKIYFEDEDEIPVKDYYCGVWGKYSSGEHSGDYYIVLGGSNWVKDKITTDNYQDSILNSLFNNNIIYSTNKKDSAAPFFTIDNYVKNFKDLLTWIGTSSDRFESTYINAIAAIEDGATFDSDGLTIPQGGIEKTVGKIPVALDLFKGLIDIKPKTFAVLNQKSACEKITKVNLSNIGYDKWLYDEVAPFILGDLSSVSKENFNYKMYFTLSKEKPNNLSEDYSNLRLYSYDKDLKGNNVADCSTDIGSKNISKDFLISAVKEVSGNGISEIADSETRGNLEGKLQYNIFYCASKTKFVKESENDKEYPLRKDINYNTMTFKVTEEVYPGQDTSGGEFYGSLSEKGKDANGANIFWPNVLNDNDFSFVEITPIQKFDDTGLVNDRGIYLGRRIVDDKLIEDFTGESVGSSKELTLKGQRYVTHIVEKNIKEGTTGGAWRDEFWTVVQQGWNEASDTNYDDVYVFMDPTGQEAVHTMQSSLVAGTHQLAIAISPKIITKPEFTNPSSIVVTARNKQCAQYAGEFKVYDEYTGKNFWCCPIGDIGLMCARIFDKKMGGWPPAWYNYNNLGGQLSRSVLEARWRFSDSATQILDTKGINPIVYNPDDGLMVVSSKTTQDPNNLTDWSFLEHVMAFVLLKRDIRDNVMRPQIEKPIDDYFMDMRQTQVDAILAKRISGANRIWTSAVCDIKGVNNDVTKAQRKFCILVKVKVTPFAQEVELTLQNVAQTTVL